MATFGDITTEDKFGQAPKATTSVGTVSVEQPVSVTGPLTDAELRATPVPVSGMVSITEPVSVDDNGGSLTVDGPLTDVELRATPVPVSGTVSVTEPVSVDDNGGSLTVDGPLTDTELRATPVPVSGTVSVTEPVSVDDNGGSLTVDGPLTDAELRATPVPVSGTVSVTEPVSVDDNGASLTVDTPQLPAALVGGRLDTVIGAALPAGTNNIGDVDVLTVPAPLSTAGGGTEATALRVTVANDSTGVLSVDDNGGSLTVDGSVVNTPAQNSGKTINRFVLAQGAVPGTTQISAASPGNKHKVVGVLLTISGLNGTVKFTGTADLTGAVTLSVNGGFVIPPNTNMIFIETGVNEALSVVSTLGGVNGVVLYLTEP